MHPFPSTWTAAGLAGLLALACRTEPAAIVVEADTTAVSGPARPVVQPAPPPQAPEVLVLEEPAESPAIQESAEERAEALAEETLARQAAEGEPDAEIAAAPDGDRGRVVLPAGLRLPLELRTPLHSGTTRVGDRFAARTLEPVLVDGRTALPPGALVEGKVAGVVRAQEEAPGQIELDFRHLVLPDGTRVDIDAEIASIEGREAVRRGPSAAAVAGGSIGGAVIGAAVGGRRGAAIGSVVGALGATLMAGAMDHEVVVPSGTAMELALRAPLTLPGAD